MLRIRREGFAAWSRIDRRTLKGGRGRRRKRQTEWDAGCRLLQSGRIGKHLPAVLN